MFYSIVNVFTVTFVQVHASLLNKSIIIIILFFLVTLNFKVSLLHIKQLYVLTIGLK